MSESKHWKSPVFRTRFLASDLIRVIWWLMLKLAYMTVPVSWLFRVARFKGVCLYLTSSERRDVKRNIASVFTGVRSDSEMNQIARRYFEFWQKRSLTLIWPKVQNFSCADRCQVEGIEHLELALSQGKGAMLLTAHFGHERLINHILERKSYPVWVVGRKTPRHERKRPEKLSAFAYNVRYNLLKLPEFSRIEERSLPIGLNIRPLVQALNRNEILMLTMDGLLSTTLCEVKLLGRTTLFSGGSIMLAKGTGAAILPTFVVDTDTDAIGIKLVIHEPLELEFTGDLKLDLKTNLSRLAQVFEGVICRYPHNYRWNKRDFFSKNRLKALHADVADRYRRNYARKKKSRQQGEIVSDKQGTDA